MATTAQLSAELTYTSGKTEDVTDSASWTSSDESVATVSASGLVAAVAAGEATITATAEGLEGSATVTVSEPEDQPETLTVSPGSVELTTE